MGMRSRSQDFLGISWTIVFSYKLKLCKEFNRVSGDWSVRIKATSDLFNLMHKESIKLSGRDSGEIFEGSIVSPNLPIIRLLRRKSARELPQFPRTTTVYSLMAKIIFLSLTDHV